MTFYRFYMKLPHSERYFSTLVRIKTFLRPTVGRDQLSSITAISIEREYANKTMQYFVILYLRNVDLDLPSENLCTTLISLALTALRI